MKLEVILPFRFSLFLLALVCFVACDIEKEEELEEDFSAFVGNWISKDFCGNTSEATIIVSLSSRPEYDLDVSDPNRPLTILGATAENNQFEIPSQIYLNSFGEEVTFEGSGTLVGEFLQFTLTASLLEIPSSCSGTYSKL